MKKKIINGLLFAAALVVASSSFVSCKDYEGDNIALQQEEMSGLKAALAQQIVAMQDYCLKTKCKEARDLLENRILALETAGYITKADLNGLATEGWVNNQHFATESWVKDQIPTLIKDNNSALNQAVTTVINQYLQNHGLSGDLDLSQYALKSEIPDVSAFLKSGDLANYYTKAEVDALENIWANNIFTSETFKNLQALANNALIQANSAKEQADKALENAAKAQKSADDAYNYAQNVYIAADQAAKAAKAAQKKADEAFDKATENAGLIAKNAEGIAKNAEGIAKNAEDIASLKALTDELKKTDEAMQKDIEELQKQLKDVQEQIDNINGRLKKLITGIEIQGAYNPVFGYLNTPLGVRSDILAANYGEALNGVEFPTSRDASYYNEVSIISPEEWNLVKDYLPAFELKKNKFKAGDVIMNREEGNAGTLYLQVNHAADAANVDFSGTQFSLRTSNNNVSLVELSPLEPSTKELYFGYHRAAVNGVSENGFYEAKATVDWSVADKVAPRYDMIKIAKQLKDAIDVNRTDRTVKVNFGEIAATIYSNVKEVLPALGVQANWQDEEGFKLYKTECKMAATAVKALNFGLGYDYRVKPKQWISYIDGARIDNEIREMIAFELNINPINLGTITVDRGTGEVWAEKRDNNGNVIMIVTDVIKNDDGTITKKEEPMRINITNIVDKIYTDLNTALQKYNDAVPNINDIPNQISAAVEKMGDSMADKLSDFVNKYVSRVNSYIKRANNLINNANKVLQPLLVSKATDGSYVQLSRLWAAPTQVNDGDIIALLPTTFTGELVVPCYMKNLCVTNVFEGYGVGEKSAVMGDAACKSKLGDANKAISSDMLYTSPTQWGGFNAAGLRGYTYEITYTAMDYSGRVSGKKYYIYVK